MKITIMQQASTAPAYRNHQNCHCQDRTGQLLGTGNGEATPMSCAHCKPSHLKVISL